MDQGQPQSPGRGVLKITSGQGTSWSSTVCSKQWSSVLGAPESPGESAENAWVLVSPPRDSNSIGLGQVLVLRSLHACKMAATAPSGKRCPVQFLGSQNTLGRVQRQEARSPFSAQLFTSRGSIPRSPTRASAFWPELYHGAPSWPPLAVDLNKALFTLWVREGPTPPLRADAPTWLCQQGGSRRDGYWIGHWRVSPWPLCWGVGERVTV